MTPRPLRTIGAPIALSLAVLSAACTPTINIKVEPISIYAKLDADIRIKLDKEVETAIQQNPNLFN
jgi:hypothetical protein